LRIVITCILILVAAIAKGQSAALTVADSLYATGNYTKAINAYAAVGDKSSVLQIARAYKAIGNYEKAIMQYQALEQQNPEMHIASFELGKLFFAVKNFNEAQKIFANLASSVKSNPEYYYYLGESLRELGEPANSLISFKNAIALDSTHLRSLFQLAKYFTIKKERDNALQYVDAGLRFYENNVSFINLKALIYYNDGQYKQAIPLFEKLLELGEHKAYVYEKLGYSYYKNWDFEKAKEAYKTLLAINDSNSLTYLSLAEVYRKNKQLDSAEIHIKKGMDVKRPIFAQGYSMLAGLARERKDLKKALEYYKLAHKELPAKPRHYFQICTVLDQLSADAIEKLKCYKNFTEKYGTKQPYLSEIVTKRISELRAQIHFNTD